MTNFARDDFVLISRVRENCAHWVKNTYGMAVTVRADDFRKSVLILVRSDGSMFHTLLHIDTHVVNYLTMMI